MHWVREIARGAAWLFGVGLVLLLFQTGLSSPYVPLALRAIMAALLLLTLARPGDGLLAVAALIPLATAGATAFHVPGARRWSEMLVYALVAGCLLHWSRRRPPGLDTATRIPLAIFAVVVSSAVLIQVLPSAWEYEPYREELQTLLFLKYLEAGPIFHVIVEGSRILSGLALFWVTARLCAAMPELRGRVARMIAIGAAAAAAINILRLVFASMRPGMFWSLFADHLAHTRYNYHYGDVNAAGSYFALVLVLAAGIVLSNVRRLRWWIVAATIAAGLWISGSRVAILSVALAATAALIVKAVRAGRIAPLRAVAGVAAAFLLLVGAVAVMFLAFDTVRPASEALKGRVTLVTAAVKAYQEEPVFGVGLARYFTLSEKYLPDWFRRSNLYFRRENAHNDFLQVLVELGIVGLLPFVWLLIAVGWRLRRAALPAGGVAVFAAACVFLLTSMGGHPLLTRDVAYTFWLTFGLVYAYGISTPSSRAFKTVGAIALAAVLIALPVRLYTAMRTLDREHVAWGVSPWTPAAEGYRTRTVGQRAVFFVPGDARGAVLPFRGRRESDTPHTIEIWFEGRLANRVMTKGTEWVRVNLVLPESPREAFYRIEVRVSGPVPDGSDPETDAGVEMGWIEPTR